jgi:hypothetical protein
MTRFVKNGIKILNWLDNAGVGGQEFVDPNPGARATVFRREVP